MEKILCAAIHKPGDIDIAGNPLIYCGLRDCNILWQGRHVSRDLDHQGFLTSKGRFVSREEAFVIAEREDQIIEPAYTRGNTLYSEDLY